MKNIALVSVYTPDRQAFAMYTTILYQLLGERKPDESISHKEMPSIPNHIEFVKSKPYEAWYLIQSLEEKEYPFVGAVYLSNANEIGIGIFDKYKRQHYACAAIKALMEYHHEGFYLANINPDNYKSKELFKRLGFKFHKSLKENCKIIQDTYLYLPNPEA